MAQFILIIREDLSKYPRPEAELDAIVSAHSKWARELAAKGIFKDGNGVKSSGKLLEIIDGKVIAGPLRDVKQGVGGYYIIEAESLNAAVEIAAQMPTYNLGDLVEVRELSA